jgi:hypothetical protein
LSEAERAELEAEYFADPRAFDRLELFENDLIDDYARGRLGAQTRARFERAYLSNPSRRARLKFGEALAAHHAQLLDQVKLPVVTAVSGGPWWRNLFPRLSLERRALAFSMAVALLLLAFGSGWLLIQSRRLRTELAQQQAMQTRQEEYAAELQRQLADEQKRSQELTAELQRASNPVTPPTKPLSETPAPAFVTLLLAANGVRGAETGSPHTLTIPKGTEQVHVQLSLKDNDYRTYQIVLRAIDGPEILNRQDLRPRTTRSGATVSLSLPASKLIGGDYMLTLRGALQSGEFEDVSKSLFRVEKR